MTVIALTGGIGAGKSTVSATFKDLGAKIIDADEIGRELMQPGGRAYLSVVAEFGSGILMPDGEIDRKALADIVFSDAELLSRLNEITHGHIFDEMRNRLFNTEKDSVVILDVPLLFQCDFPFSYHVSIAVIADDEVRISRIIKRDNCTREDAKKRLSSQLSNEEFRDRADICIENNDSVTALRSQVRALYNSIQKTDRGAIF